MSKSRNLHLLKLYGCFVDDKIQCLMYSVPCPCPLLSCAEDRLFDFSVPLSDLQLMDVTIPPGSGWSNVQSVLIQTEAQAKEWVLVMARFHLVCVQCRPSWQERAVDLLQKRLFQAVASPSDLSSMVVDCDDCLTQMKCNFERVINSELLGLHVLMTEEDMASIVACKHAAEQEPHNRQLGRGGGTADCPPIWRSDLDRTLHSPPLSPDSTDNDPIDKDPDLDTTLVPSGWAERADYAQQYLLPDAFPNSFVPPGRETYQTTCAVHTIPKLTPSRLPITSNPFDLMADVLVDTIRGAFLRNPSKASTTEVKSIGLEHLRVGLIVRRPFK